MESPQIQNASCEGHLEEYPYLLQAPTFCPAGRARLPGWALEGLALHGKPSASPTNQGQASKTEQSWEAPVSGLY